LLMPDANGQLVPAAGCLRAEVLELLEGGGLASAAFRTDRIHGRVFFTGLTFPISELVPLTEVVAREVGLSLSQLYAAEKLKDVATKEARIRVARDLHDGILQSLTGIRLELRATVVALGDAPAVRERLNAIESALAMEQRALRFFVTGLGTPRGRRPDASLIGELESMKERIALEWKLPVTIRCAVHAAPPHIESAVPSMVHEAVVNALKHGQPSRVTVLVDGSEEDLRITVVDDGRGFGFRGRRDHRALKESKLGPRSLLDRVAALGGEIAVDSSESGSRVEIRFNTTAFPRSA
jgi:signal transduction histidine kinase